MCFESIRFNKSLYMQAICIHFYSYQELYFYLIIFCIKYKSNNTNDLQKCLIYLFVLNTILKGKVPCKALRIVSHTVSHTIANAYRMRLKVPLRHFICIMIQSIGLIHKSR